MPLIDWNESLSVKISEIDQQHMKFIFLINDLNDAMSKGKGNEALAEIFTELIKYTEMHFKTEEKYFAQYGYPAAFSHKQEHADFVKKIYSLKDEYNAGKLAISVKTIHFLKDWLITHVNGTDKKYSKFFNDYGLH